MTEHLAEVLDLDVDSLSAEERVIRARQAWRQSGGTLTGIELAGRFKRSERWGRQQVAAARAEAAAAGNGNGNGNGDGGSPAAAAVVRQPGAATPPAAPLPPAPRQRQERQPAARRQPAAAAVAAGGGTVPLPFQVVTLGSVALVAAVCAVASYVHLHDLVEAAGGKWLAWVLPTGIDGMTVAGATVLIAHHRYGGQRRTRTFAVLAVALGLAASVAANVAAVDPSLVDIRHVRWALAAYPPLGLALVSDLALSMVRGEPRRRQWQQ